MTAIDAKSRLLHVVRADRWDCPAYRWVKWWGGIHPSAEILKGLSPDKKRKYTRPCWRWERRQ